MAHVCTGAVQREETSSRKQSLDEDLLGSGVGPGSGQAGLRGDSGGAGEAGKEAVQVTWAGQFRFCSRDCTSKEAMVQQRQGDSGSPRCTRLVA